jgi:hypothetical protein
MRRDPSRQSSVGRDERRGPLRYLQRLAEDQRDCLSLLRRSREFSGGHAFQPAILRGDLRPLAGEVRGRQRVSDRAASGGIGVVPATLAPSLDLAARDTHAQEHQLHMELRMGFDRAAREPGYGVGIMRAECVPFLVGQRQVEPGEHHQTLRHVGYAPQQPRDRRRGVGHARRTHYPGRRHAPPSLGEPVEQCRAPCRRIDPLQPRQFAGPALQHDLERRQRAPPMLGELGSKLDIA